VRVRVLPSVAFLIVITACGSGVADETPTCGWDLRSAAGKQASSDRLTFASRWLVDHPGEPVPAPTSSYWHGDCPAATKPPAPPIDESDQPDE